MDPVPTSQLYNDHNKRLTQPSPLYNAPISSRPPNNSHKPPTHPLPNTHQYHQQQQSNLWREVSTVATTTLYPTRPPPPVPRPDTSSFVILMYATLSVAPDSSPPQVEAARTLHSMGYPPSRPDPPITHVSAVGGAGTITVSAAAPPTSTAPARPPYSTDNFYRDPSRLERTYNDNYIDRPQHHYQPETLPRPHDYPASTHALQAHEPHMQQSHMQQSHMQQAHLPQPLMHQPLMHQPHSLPPQPAPLDTRHQPYLLHHEYDRQVHPTHSLPDTTALSRQPRANVPIIFRSDASVPATPTTPATSATNPFSATPSSPENNGASSNGSAHREHACTFPGCTKTFDRRYNLTVHFRRHTNEMPYPCKFPGCPQKFKWRSSQSHHMKTRHQMGAGGRGSRTNAMRQTGNTTGGAAGGYSAARVTAAAAVTENSMPPSHASAPLGLGLAGDDEPTGTYKRAFSPRKRQRGQRHIS